MQINLAIINKLKSYVPNEYQSNLSSMLLTRLQNQIEGIELIKGSVASGMTTAAKDTFMTISDLDFVEILRFVKLNSSFNTYLPILSGIFNVYKAHEANLPQSSKEIERKVLITGFPYFTPGDQCTIYQSYISFEPEIRIRKRVRIDNSETYKLAMKSKGNLSRIEIQFDIDKELYEELLSYVSEFKPIKKEFKAYSYNGITLECSNVDDGKFCYAEIEFDDIQEAQEYNVETIPGFLEDVTSNPKYKMSSYWVQTRL